MVGRTRLALTGPRARWHVASFVVVVGLMQLLTSFMTTRFEELTGTPDIGHEWIVVEAAWSGIDPTRDLGELADLVGFPVDYTLVSPRPPAVFVVQAPLRLVPVGALGWVAMILSAASIVFIVSAGASRASVRPTWVPLLSAAFCLAAPMAHAITALNLVFITTALVAWTVVLADRDDRWIFGVPLGLAVAVRLWPAPVIVALILCGRRRTALGAVATATLTSVAGLALPAVSARSTLDGLVAGGEAWSDHGSNLSLLTQLSEPLGLPAALVIGVLLLLGVLRSANRSSVVGASGMAAIAGAAISPLAWGSYLCAAAPAVGEYWAAPKLRAPLTFVLALLATHVEGAWNLIAAAALIGMGLLHPSRSTSGTLARTVHE